MHIGPTRLDLAVDWLEDRLRGKAETRHTIATAAARHGISPTTLKRAATKLGVTSTNQATSPRTTLWHLP